MKENYVLVVTKLHANFNPFEHWVIFEKITPPSLFVDEVEQGLLTDAPNWRDPLVAEPPLHAFYCVQPAGCKLNFQGIIYTIIMSLYGNYW